MSGWGGCQSLRRLPVRHTHTFGVPAPKRRREADKLEAEEQESKNNTLFGELGIEPELLQLDPEMMAHVVELMDTKDGVLSRQTTKGAVIVIDAQGIVQMASLVRA